MERFAPLLLLAFCAACSSSTKCVIPVDAGTCAVDSDCVIAVCADSPCNCGCGSAIATSQLDVSACLVASGTAAPSSCRPTGPQCECASRQCGVACDAGICVVTIPDGG